ncbi:glycosyltransferase [Pseudomonas sp. nanlin1]|uniref:glycosyltransferase n=1 Tax=Pseudomonas sp. nanlin1 TaxID=3040605 RepID=UPI003890690C
MSQPGLVSIVIPSYKSAYFEAALKSAMAQDYSDVEIIVTDDCPDNSIGAIVDALRPTSPWPIRYIHNSPSLGEVANVKAGVDLAQGEYLKLLYDDDMLDPECVRLLIDAMEGNPSVTLASSRRVRIDQWGEPLPDIPATVFPFACDVLLDGKDVTSFLGEHTVNFIGEPSSMLCRRAELLAFGDGIYSLGGEAINSIGDVALQVKLLQKGDLAFLAKPLSFFRISPEQFSQQDREDPTSAIYYHHLLRRQIRQLGWQRPEFDSCFVMGARLDRPSQWSRIDLLATFTGQETVQQHKDEVQAWETLRHPTAVAYTAAQQKLQACAEPLSLLVVIVDHNDDIQALTRTLQSLGDATAAEVRLQVLILTPRPVPPADNPADGVYWRTLTPDGIRACLSDAVQRYDFDWMLRVSAGETFCSGGWVMALGELTGADLCDAVYADEFQPTAGGSLKAVKRPDFNLDYLLSAPAVMAGHWFLARQFLIPLAEQGGQDFPQDDLGFLLRLLELQGAAGIGHIDEFILHSQRSRGAIDSMADAVRTHLQVRGYAQAAVRVESGAGLRLNYGDTAQAAVSIVCDLVSMGQQGLASVQSLLHHTVHSHYEVVIVATAEQLSALDTQADSRVRFVESDASCGGIRLNAGRARCSHSILLFITEALQFDQGAWLSEMLNHMQRDEVVAVGPCVLSSDGSLRRDPNDSEALAVSRVDHNRASLPGSVVMVEAQTFDALGGMAQAYVSARYTVHDLSLRIVAGGGLGVWAANAQVLASDS